MNKVPIIITILEICAPPAAGERQNSGHDKDTKIRESNEKETGNGKKEVMNVKYRFVQQAEKGKK